VYPSIEHVFGIEFTTQKHGWCDYQNKTGVFMKLTFGVFVPT